MSARWLTHEEIEALDCCLTAGIAPAPDTVGRMMATIRQLQRELRQQASRIADDREAGYLPAPGTVAARVTSAVPDEPAAVGRAAR